MTPIDRARRRVDWLDVLMVVAIGCAVVAAVAITVTFHVLVVVSIEQHLWIGAVAMLGFAGLSDALWLFGAVQLWRSR